MSNLTILEVMWGFEDIFIDVTEKFKKLYAQKDDIIYASRENFGDPVPYKYKILKVKYIK